MTIYDKLNALGIQLGQAATPAGSYLPYVIQGGQVFLSGHLSRRSGQVWQGKLGAGMDTEEGRQAARAVAIDLITTLHHAVGDLGRIARIVKLTSLVHSDAGFTEQHLVTNGASDLLAEVFGDKGRHARSAFGVAQLPLGACVEIELVAQLEA